MQEEIEQAGDEGVPENPPTLSQFKEQVDNYEKVYLEVEKFEVSYKFSSDYKSLRLLCVFFLGDQSDRHMVSCGCPTIQTGSADHRQEMELHVQAAPH